MSPLTHSSLTSLGELVELWRRRLVAPFYSTLNVNRSAYFEITCSTLGKKFTVTLAHALEEQHQYNAPNHRSYSRFETLKKDKQMRLL